MSSIIAAASSILAAASLSMGDFLNSVLLAGQSLGGASWSLKIASIVMLLVGSMKVSFLNDLVWAKFGALKAWAAPTLGLCLGILLLSANGQLTLASALAYMASGAGALALHELLDGIKAIPGLGPIYISIINAIEGSLPAKLARKKALAAKKK